MSVSLEPLFEDPLQPQDTIGGWLQSVRPSIQCPEPQLQPFFFSLQNVLTLRPDNDDHEEERAKKEKQYHVRDEDEKETSKKQRILKPVRPWRNETSDLSHWRLEEEIKSIKEASSEDKELVFLLTEA